MKRVLGVDVGGTKIASCLVDPEDNFRVLNNVILPTEAQQGWDTILNNIFASIDRPLAAAQLTAADLSGIGIGLPGIIDVDSGVVHIEHENVIECPRFPEWKNFPIRKILEERYQTPVYVENDAKAAAVAEASLGAGKGFQHLLYIGLGTGIGCGIIIDGKLYRGCNGVAGELSHISYADKVPLYQIASGMALFDMFGLSGEDLHALCEAQDPLARKAFDHLILHFGIGIGNAVTLFNPEAVILGGGLMNMGDFLFMPLEAEVRKNAFSSSATRLKFLKAHYQQDAGAIGIAYLAWEYYHSLSNVSHQEG